MASEYSQGVCHDGTAILKDGYPMRIEEILAELRAAQSRTMLAAAPAVQGKPVEALAAHVERINEIVERMKRKGELWDEHALVLATDDPPETSLAHHPDDAAVDRFAEAMKAKLAAARAKGRDGWDNPDLCPAEFLATLLVGHIGKANAGNLEDIAALAMMLHQRGDDPSVVAQALARLKAQWQAEALQELYTTWKGEGMMRVGALLDKAIELQEEVEGGEP